MTTLDLVDLISLIAIGIALGTMLGAWAIWRALDNIFHDDEQTKN